PLGRRVGKATGSDVTAWTYSDSDILRQTSSTGTLKYILGPGIDEPMATDDGSAMGYFHSDGLGSITNASNASGAGSLLHRYDPKHKDEYQCVTISTDDQVEDCVVRRARRAEMDPPTHYIAAAKGIGGNQCNDWAHDVIAGCIAEVKLRQLQARPSSGPPQ